jgi:hypothetical protein
MPSYEYVNSEAIRKITDVLDSKIFAVGNRVATTIDEYYCEWEIPTGELKTRLKFTVPDTLIDVVPVDFCMNKT